MSLLVRLAQLATTKGRTLRIRLGTRDVRDLSDGVFPVEVFRCARLRDGSIVAVAKRTVRKLETLRAGIDHAATGWNPNASQEWVEIRTHASRVPAASS